MKNLAIVFIALAITTSAEAKKTSTANRPVSASKQQSTDSILSSIDSLGTNQPLAEKAKAIDGKNKVSVVQNRLVDRDMRLELGASYGLATGGDSYINTQNLGFMADFHIVPQFSIGVRHSQYYNELTNEGKRVFDDAQKKQAAGDPYTKPDVDYPLSSTMGVFTVYPLYGKLNFFNIGVTQFDLYMLAGYGQMQTSSGYSATWTAGGGVGIWWTNLITSRLEARQQGYEDKIYTGNRQQSVTHFTAGIGFLL